MIHYLHEDDAGPIHSGSDGVSDPHGMLAKQGADLKPKRLRFACNPTAEQSHFHRGTNFTEKVAGGRYVVTCPNCLASERFLRDAAEKEFLDGPDVMFDASGKRCC